LELRDDEKHDHPSRIDQNSKPVVSSEMHHCPSMRREMLFASRQKQGSQETQEKGDTTSTNFSTIDIQNPTKIQINTFNGDNKNQPFPYLCPACDCKFENLNIFISHFAGKRHQKNMKVKGESQASWSCGICGKQNLLGEDIFKNHFRGRSHQKCLETKLVAGSEAYHCPICKTAQLSTVESFLGHFNGKNHQKKKRSVAESLVIWKCGLCALTLNSESEFIHHMRSSGHIPKTS